MKRHNCSGHAEPTRSSPREVPREPILTKEQRLAALYSASPAKLTEIDAVLAELPRARPHSFRLYRVGEAAKVLNRSRYSVWRAISEGRIRTVHLRSGGVNLIPEEELRRLVAGELDVDDRDSGSAS